MARILRFLKNRISQALIIRLKMGPNTVTAKEDAQSVLDALVSYTFQLGAAPDAAVAAAAAAAHAKASGMEALGSFLALVA